MAQVISAHNFKMRFPRFADAPSATIEFAIEEAAMSVDETWGAYQTLGMLYMTAHILMVEIMRAASGTGQEMASQSFSGVLSVTYQPTKPTDDELSTTYYGQRVIGIMAGIFPAVAIV